MKPLSLSLTAFGSYPGTETVDFTALSSLGVYVVTGPTGSGKTTVFDAMAYALYGEVPGVRDVADIRSHHADSNIICSVTFRFEVAGIVYRVERKPEQLRPSKRKGADLVKQATSAVLVREDDDVSIATRSGAVTDACVDLVGLNGSQFERVMLLPQGLFQKFLLAGTTERRVLLRQLFDSGRWDSVTERLKIRMNEARSAVIAIETQIGNHRHSIVASLRQAAEYLDHEMPILADDESVKAATLGSLEDLRRELDEAAASRRTAAHQAVDEARVASDQEAKAERMVTDWNARRELRVEARALADETPAIDAIRLRLAADAIAQPVISAIGSLDAATREDERITGLVVTARERVVELCEAAGVEAHESFPPLVTALAEARSAMASERQALDGAVDALALRNLLSGQVAEATAERTRLTERLAEIDVDLEERTARHDELVPIAERLATLQFEVTAAFERLEWADRVARLVDEKVAASAAVITARDVHQELLDRFIADAAPRLASELVEGHPCPACGSTDHPSPAVAASDETVDVSRLDEAARVISSAAGVVEGLDAELRVVLSALGDEAGLPIDHFADRLALARTLFAEAESAAGERKALADAIHDVRTAREGVVGRASELDLRLARLGSDLEGAQERLAQARGALGDLAERFDSEGEALLGVFAIRSEQFDQLETAITAWSSALTQADGAEGVLRNATEQFRDALAGSGLEDRAAAEAVAIDEAERVDLEARITVFDGRRVIVDARLPDLEALDLPDDCPDISEIKTEADGRRQAAALLSSEVTRIDENLGLAHDETEKARTVTSGAAGAFERADQLTALAKTCDGQGPRRISLETWVLAGELDRVVLAASVHLERMTSGRYRLERTDAAHGTAQAGLDLNVRDAHTGVSRPPKSLSGGEQFLASLSLALGLADVVSHGGSASGRTFEALFVDEGFGSLDPESLAQAVDAIHQIHAAGRKVGVITHVEAMKEDLPLGIRVERLGNGNGSTLRCYPEL
jgi:exonuclease SbcC